MNKKIFAATLSTVLLVNSLAFATADTPTTTKNPMSASQLDAIIGGGKQQTTDELQAALIQVLALKSSLNELGQSKEKNLGLRYANYLEVVLAGISASAMYAHINSTEKSNLKLAASVAALAVHRYIEYVKAKKDNKLDAGVLSEKIAQSADDLEKLNALSPELLKVKEALNALSVNLIENQNAVQQIFSKSGPTEDLVLIANIAYFVLHLAYPKLTKESDGFLKNVLPKLEQFAAKAVQIGQKPGAAYGASGAVGASDILALALGTSSEQAQQTVSKTVLNLDTVALQLKSEILARRAN